jgi:hypothetical protein
VTTYGSIYKLRRVCEGGTILAEHDVHESFNGDGLIAAYFGREPLEWKEPPTVGTGTAPACPGTRFTFLPQHRDLLAEAV